MNPTVLAALIGSITSIAVCLISNWQQNKKRAIEAAVSEAKLEARLANIEHKLDTHNEYAEKIGTMRTDIAFIKGKLEKGA